MGDKPMKIEIRDDCLPVIISYEGKEYLIKSTKEKKLHMSRNDKTIDKKHK